MAIKSVHDNLIEDFINDQRYEVEDSGIIRRSRGGVIGFTRNGEAIHRNKRYQYIRYKGVDLKVHRIIYRKFVGELQKRKVIHHKDGNGMNNAASNLEQVTQKKNVEYTHTKEDVPF